MVYKKQILGDTSNRPDTIHKLKKHYTRDIFRFENNRTHGLPSTPLGDISNRSEFHGVQTNLRTLN